MLVTIMALGANQGFAMENPLQKLTGTVWMDSSVEAKKALIYGVSCAVAMEYETVKYAAEKNGKSVEHNAIVESLNAFAENYIIAFADSSNDAIVTAIDEWYLDNPKELTQPVFKVLWYEVMEPKFQKR